MFALLWWLLIFAAGFQAFRAWGGIGAFGTVVGLWLAAIFLPFGGLITTIGAIAIGASAESAQKRLSG